MVQPQPLQSIVILQAAYGESTAATTQSGTSREAAMSNLLTVHDPRGYAPKVTGKRLAARPQSLDGKHLYLVDCLFDNSEVFMDQLRRWFGEHLPLVKTDIIKPRESWVDDPDMRSKIEADGDAAILGVGL